RIEAIVAPLHSQDDDDAAFVTLGTEAGSAGRLDEQPGDQWNRGGGNRGGERKRLAAGDTCHCNVSSFCSANLEAPACSGQLIMRRCHHDTGEPERAAVPGGPTLERIECEAGCGVKPIEERLGGE